MEPHEGHANRYALGRRASWLLEATVHDLRTRADTEDEYTKLGIAGILRRVLIDQHSIAALAVRVRHAAPLTFRFRAAPLVPSSMPFGTDIRFPSPGAFRVHDQEGTIDELRRAAVASANGVAITVDMLIRHFANVEGGVHLGHPKGEIETALGAVFGFRTDGWRHGLELLSDVAIVVADGLTPLLPQRREDPPTLL